MGLPVRGLLGAFKSNSKRNVLKHCHPNDASEMNIFASDMVSTDYIKGQIEHIKGNTKIVTIELEDLIDRNDPDEILNELITLVTSTTTTTKDQRSWKRFQCVDTIPYDVFALFQSHRANILQKFLEAHAKNAKANNSQTSLLQESFSHFQESFSQLQRITHDIQTRDDVIPAFRVNVEIPVGTTVQSVTNLLKCLTKDKNIYKVEYEGALFQTEETQVPIAFRKLFQKPQGATEEGDEKNKKSKKGDADTKLWELEQSIRLKLMYEPNHQLADEEEVYPTSFSPGSLKLCLAELKRVGQQEEEQVQIVFEGNLEDMMMSMNDSKSLDGRSRHSMRSKRSSKTQRTNKTQRSSGVSTHASKKKRQSSIDRQSLQDFLAAQQDALQDFLASQNLDDDDLSLTLDDLSVLTPNTAADNTAACDVSVSSTSNHGQTEAPDYDWSSHRSVGHDSVASTAAPARILRRQSSVRRSKSCAGQALESMTAAAAAAAKTAGGSSSGSSSSRRNAPKRSTSLYVPSSSSQGDGHGSGGLSRRAPPSRSSSGLSRGMPTGRSSFGGTNAPASLCELRKAAQQARSNKTQGNMLNVQDSASRVTGQANATWTHKQRPVRSKSMIYSTSKNKKDNPLLAAVGGLVAENDNATSKKSSTRNSMPARRGLSDLTGADKKKRSSSSSKSSKKKEINPELMGPPGAVDSSSKNISMTCAA